KVFHAVHLRLSWSRLWCLGRAGLIELRFCYCDVPKGGRQLETADSFIAAVAFERTAGQQIVVLASLLRRPARIIRADLSLFTVCSRRESHELQTGSRTRLVRGSG